MWHKHRLVLVLVGLLGLVALFLFRPPKTAPQPEAIRESGQTPATIQTPEPSKEVLPVRGEWPSLRKEGPRPEELSPSRKANAIDRMGAPIYASSGKPARFVMHDGNISAYFTDRGISLAIGKGSRDRRGMPHPEEELKEEAAVTWGLHWELADARSVEPRSEGELPGKVNVLVGQPSEWKRDLATYSRVAYDGIRPGVNMVVESRPHGVKYTLHAEPGAVQDAIHLRYEGAEKLRVVENGAALEIRTGVGVIREEALTCYQPLGPAGVKDIRARYGEVRSLGGNQSWEYTLVLENVDPALPLVIDPGIVWSRYLGGSSWENSYDIAVDGNGTAYVTGTTGSNIPPVSGSQTGTGDCFIARYDISGTQIWFLRFGGTNDETANGLAVDSSSGNIYVVGYTFSTDFILKNAFQSSKAGGYDGFVTKFDPTGAVLWSSYFGGPGFDYCMDVATYGADLCVMGYTTASGFPVTSSPSSSYGGGPKDLFVAKLNGGGGTSAKTWARYLGGSGEDWGQSLAIDGSGNIYVAGQTSTQSGFPGVTMDPSEGYYGGPQDIFLTKIDAQGNVVRTNYVGGPGDEFAFTVATDPSGTAYIGGYTKSTFFSSFSNIGAASGGDWNAYVAKVNTNGVRYWVRHFVGGDTDGSQYDYINGITVQGNDIFLTGTTYSSSNGNPKFPVTSGAFDTTLLSPDPCDTFVARLDTDGTLLYCSYLGGSNYDFAADISAFLNGNNIYVTGTTYSTDFPLVSTALQGSSDVYIAKLDFLPPTAVITINSGASYTTVAGVTVVPEPYAGDPNGIGGYKVWNGGGTEPAGYTAGAPPATIPWTLSSGDGLKTVYFRSRDNTENESAVASDTIILDASGPVGTVVINGGSQYTKATVVSLTITASDAVSGIASMRLSNDGTMWNGWGNYATSVSWTLSTGDGTKTVYAQFRDNAGNVSANATDTIILDTVAPTVQNVTSPKPDGIYSLFTSAPFKSPIPIQIRFTESVFVSDGSLHDLRLDTGGNGSLVNYTSGSGSNTLTFTYTVNVGHNSPDLNYFSATALSANNGTIRDAAGNDAILTLPWQGNPGAGSLKVNKNILIDTLGPVGSLSINGGASYTQSQNVIITNAITDTLSGVDSMRFSNDGVTFGPFEAFAGTKSWTLSPGDGSKMVGAQFTDKAKNIQYYTDTIILDTTPPASCAITSPTANSAFAVGAQVAISANASDTGSGIEKAEFFVDSTSIGSDSTAPYGVTWNTIGVATGAHTLKARAHDKAGNTLDSAPVSVTLNAIPTITTIDPNKGGQGGQNLSLTVTGSAFQSGAAVSFSGTGITVNSTTFNSATQATANISIAAIAVIDARDVTLTNPDGGKSTKAGAFTVTAGVPGVGVNKKHLAFQAHGTDPNPQSLNLSNTGPVGTTLNFEITVAGSPLWLSVSPTNGLLASGQTIAVTVSISIAQAEVEDNKATIIFKAVGSPGVSSETTVFLKNLPVPPKLPF